MGQDGLEIYSDSQPFSKEGFLKFKKTMRMLVFALAAVGLVLLILAALTIWLVAATLTNTDDISKFSKDSRSGDLMPVDVSGDGIEPKDIRLSTTADVGKGFSLVSPVFQGSGYWSIRDKLPSKRSDHQVAAIGNLIYVVGGNDADGEPTDSIVIYDTVLSSFTDGPTMPTPLTRFAMVFVPDRGAEGMLYLIGGLTTSDGDASGKVHTLDVATGAWSAGPDLITPRSDFCGSLVDGNIYIAGGWPTGFTESLASVEVLGMGEKQWKEITAMPTPRGDCKCAGLSGAFVVLGGYHDETNQWKSDSFRDEVESFNPNNESWRTLAPLPNSRGDKAIIMLPNNRLLAVGGETHHDGERTEVATHHVEEYLGDHDVWVTKAPLPLARFRLDGAFVDGVVYMFGGHAVCTPGENEYPRICPETDEIQAFSDAEHPALFFVEGE